MKIVIDLLYGDKTYQHNDQAEAAIRDVLIRAGLQATSATSLRQGPRPEFDYIIEGFLTEQKITRKFSLFVELFYDQDKTKPSAYSLCTAPLSLIVMPGRSGTHGDVWKIRLVRTLDLISIATSPQLFDGDFVDTHAHISTVNAYGVPVKLHLIPHVWVCDIARTSLEVIDTDAVVKLNPKLVDDFKYHFTSAPDLLTKSTYEYFKLFINGL